MLNYIYTLTDPRDNIIKYIGKTNNINKRFNLHLNEKNSNTKKANWINDLKNNNLKILDIGTTEEINKLEIYWISQFKAWGFELKNFTNGGDGGWDNKKHTPLSIEKMRNNNPNMKNVVLFDINMKPLKKFKSLREASRETGLERFAILRSCKKNIMAYGCYFKHTSIEFEETKNWKIFLKKRTYNDLVNLYNIDEWYKIVQKSVSCKDICKNINMEYTKALESKIYTIIKKLKLSTAHFIRNKVKNKNKNVF